MRIVRRDVSARQLGQKKKSLRREASWHRGQPALHLAQADGQGALTAAGAGEEVVPASELRAAHQRIRELQRLLGKKTLENEILREAVERVTAPRKRWCIAAAAPFDFVYSVAVWEHVVCPMAFARKLLSLVAPGGVLVMICPDYGSFAERLGPAWPTSSLGASLDPTREDWRASDEKSTELGLVRRNIDALASP